MTDWSHSPDSQEVGQAHMHYGHLYEIDTIMIAFAINTSLEI